MNMMTKRTEDLNPRGRQPYGFLICALLGVAGLVALGTWQLDRLAYKEALIADRQAALALPPLDLAQIPANPEALAYRRVRVTGRFLLENELPIGPRSRRGRPGWEVISPLLRADGSVVLINRGWVADSHKEAIKRKPEPVAGTVTVTGYLKLPTRPSAFAPDNDPAKGNWYWVDPAAMAAHLKLEKVAPYWVMALRDRDRMTGPAGIDRVAMPANNHLKYAVTWYALALSLSVLAFIYWRRNRPQ